MKKILVNICVVLLVVVSVFALTSCGWFGGSNQNNDNNSQIEIPNGNLDNDTEDDSQTKAPDTDLSDSSDDESEPVLIASYTYEISCVNYMIVPNLEDILEITEEELAELLPDVATLQAYINELDAAYSNATMEFWDDYSMQLTFSDGTLQNYYYAIQDNYLYLGNYVETNDGVKFYYDYQGVLQDDYIQFEMQLDDYGLVVVYMQFAEVL